MSRISKNLYSRNAGSMYHNMNTPEKSLVLLLLCCSLLMAQTGAHYLIITHDEFYEAVLPLAEWKTRTGLKTKIITLSQIGSDSTDIRNFISDAYNTWTIRPQYLLLVGAPNYLPLPRVAYVYTDNYYTNIQGDFHNDILSGRLTVHDIDEAENVIHKILGYEKNPYTEDSLWFKKACLLMTHDYDPDDSIYVSDLLYAAGLMQANGFIQIDTMCDSTGHNKDSVIQAVDNGRSIVMYRGSATNNWPYPFDVNPNLLQNDLMMPIVLSITCNTLGTGSTPAAAEKWLLTGSLAMPKGASGYFATTTGIMGGAHLRSAVAKGFHDCLFDPSSPYPVAFGQACEAGRHLVYELYMNQHEYYGFTTLGDPAMKVWTDTPCSLIVAHPETVSIGNNDVPVNVRRSGDLMPVENAVITLLSVLDTTVYEIDTTDIDGNAFFNTNLHFFEDTLILTVTGKNLKPYKGLILVSYAHGGPYIVYLKSVIDDSLGGNHDGFLNPGENINMPLWILNCGDSTGYGINGVLRSPDPYVTITDSFHTFGDILAADSTSTGMNGYDYSIAADCPDRHNIDFELHCRDINDSLWLSNFSLQVRAPDLIFEKAAISNGNGNNILEPGETVTVVIELRNQGLTAIDSVAAILQESSIYISIEDSLGDFIHIGPDSIAANDHNPFIVSADTATPLGTYIDFGVAVHSGYYSDTLQFSLIIGKLDYYIWNPDPTPQPGINMHSILTQLGYLGDIGTSLTPDPNEYKAVFVCTGVPSNNYHIYMNCSEALALEDFVNNGGMLYMEGADVWYYDVLFGNGHDFRHLCGIEGVSDGTNDMGPVIGQNNTFTENMIFDYYGENAYMDHINPAGPGSFLIFEDQNNNYNCGVAKRTDTYRTIGTSFELGLLHDNTPPSTRGVLLDSIMRFFNIGLKIAEQPHVQTPVNYNFAIAVNPLKDILRIKFWSPDKSLISIVLYDVCGRCMGKNIFNTIEQGINDLLIPVRALPAGVYFVKCTGPGYDKTEKIVLIR
jgi:hypothetical protein